uniref:Uncharacterized protein n=1 Tax=viral metagenome TaxID=1070528 RepID=A0A6C0HT28_9ZZZZ
MRKTRSKRSVKKTRSKRTKRKTRLHGFLF